MKPMTPLLAKIAPKTGYLACNGVVGFTGDGAHASKGDDGFT